MCNLLHGRFTVNGKPMGYTGVQGNIMQGLSGCWFFYSGGTLAPDCLKFYPDGHFDAMNLEESVFNNLLSKIEGKQHINFDNIPHGKLIMGNWSAVEHNPFENLYWNSPNYAIILLYDNGGTAIGFSMDDENHFNLTSWEGGDGYIRMP